jgi:hypothetical protein
MFSKTHKQETLGYRKSASTTSIYGRNESMSEQSQPSQPQLSAGEYRRHVLGTASNMLSILGLEFQTLQQQASNPFDQACFVIALQVVGELKTRAEQLEKQATELVVAKNPGLVDQDGNPLSRPARRKIQKKADDVVPDISDTEEVQA